ncbi:hypothetical protein GPECTOR_122g469 [Gonium pectorale]|uniref:Uncharacterized protein n=1 Tax=Gonium pectorale TaxID=33097 RepID=A0A150FYR8_GONPE|nr:hypothetical protein GPECTOR_122g469 [Gonium pectorale]|eukprot:KXZ42728.1 hypothetical protein GPECTOR_122g469 [Gonium pectorale]
MAPLVGGGACSGGGGFVDVDAEGSKKRGRIARCSSQWLDIRTFATTADGLLPATGTYYFTADALARIEAALRTRPLAMYRLAAPADKVPAAGAKGAAGPGYRLERRLSDFMMPAVRGA